MVCTSPSQRRSFVVAFLAGVTGGCGGAPKGPPPRPAETAIDTESARREAKRPDPNEGEILFAEPSGAASTSAASGRTNPESTATGTGPGQGASAVPATSGPAAGSGARVTKAQCDQLFDKYIELVTGLGSAEVAGFKRLLDENPAFESHKATLQGFHTSCLKDQTKAQYTCAMGARTAEEFQKCIG